MPDTGCVLGKELNAYFPSDNLCGVKDKHRCLFDCDIYRIKKKLKNQIKKQFFYLSSTLNYQLTVLPG